MKGRRDYKIVIPVNADEMILLAERVLTKHHNEGELSVLKILNMEEMEEQMILARENQKLAVLANAKKEVSIQLRDNALGVLHGQGATGTVLCYVRACRDLLLGAYKNQSYKLSDFGYELLANSKSIKTPMSAPQLIELAKKIIARHKELGENSPLRMLDMADFEAKTNIADEHNILANQLRIERTNAYKIRNITLGVDSKRTQIIERTLFYYLTAVRDVLQAVNKNSEKDLVPWGFKVHESVKGNWGRKSLEGKVTGPDGKGISGVRINVEETDKHARTKKSGNYLLRNLAAGSYTLIFNHEFYHAKTISDVEIMEDECAVLNTELEELKGSFIMSVYLYSKPFAGAEVKLLETGEIRNTDDNGDADFTGLSAGFYTAQVSAEGYRSQSKQFSIERGNYIGMGAVTLQP